MKDNISVQTTKNDSGRICDACGYQRKPTDQAHEAQCPQCGHLYPPKYKNKNVLTSKERQIQKARKQAADKALSDQARGFIKPLITKISILLILLAMGFGWYLGFHQNKEIMHYTHNVFNQCKEGKICTLRNVLNLANTGKQDLENIQITFTPSVKEPTILYKSVYIDSFETVALEDEPEITIEGYQINIHNFKSNVLIYIGIGTNIPVENSKALKALNKVEYEITTDALLVLGYPRYSNLVKKIEAFVAF